MTLNEHLVNLSKYSINFTTVEDYIIISLLFPSKWTINKPLNKNVRFEKIEERYYYAISISNNVDEVFDVIYDTIKYNKEVEEKTKLFKEKIEELKNIFANENIEVLKKIEFKIKKKRVNKIQEIENNDDINKEKVINDNKNSNNDDCVDDKIIKAINEKKE